MSKLKIRNGNTWEEIPAGGVGVPSGGSAGEMLVKSSATDYATEWVLPISMKLLWTNPDPSGTFSNQTLIPEADLSEYDFLFVSVLMSNAVAAYLNVVSYQFVEKNVTSTLVVFIGAQAVSTASNKYTSSREISFADSGGVVVGTAYQRKWNDTSSSTSSTSTDSCIPLKIWGIKGVGAQ